MPERNPGSCPGNLPTPAMEEENDEEEEEEEQRLFSSTLTSFKMDRKSPQACRLKASVSLKLVEFLGDYTDDVLAEYIVVLVCHGKHQNQAREDLEAFLGDLSGNFVAWLWHHLSEEFHLSNSKTPADSSNFKVDVITTQHDDDVKERKTGRSTYIQSSSVGICDIPLCNDGKCGPSTLSRNPISSNGPEVPEDLQHQSPDSNTFSAGINTEILQTRSCRIEQNHGATDGILTEAGKSISSRLKCSPEAGGEQSLQFEDRYQKKVTKSNSNGPPCQPSLSKRKAVSRNLQSVINAGESLSSRAVDALTHQITRPRRNVWDRLGKPCEDNPVMVQEKGYKNEADSVKRKKLNHLGEGLDKHRLMFVVPGAKLSRRSTSDIADNSRGTVMFKNDVEKNGIVDHNVDIVGTCDDVINSRQKRQFAMIDSGNGLASLFSHRDNHLQNKKADEKLPRSVANSTTPPQTLIPVNCTKLDPLNKAEGGNASHKPVQNEMLDLKLRLRQVEREMHKLRSKQAQKSVPKNPEEDVESRTVFVTNVHFAASEEALLLHFTTCGVVVKVILLTDPMTGQPKGSGFVTFASKESVDKAILLSGTSFFSRTLKVMRKAEMPAGILTSTEPSGTGRPPQPWFPSPSLTPHGKGGRITTRQQYSSSHLQWKRDQPTNPESTTIATSTADAD